MNPYQNLYDVSLDPYYNMEMKLPKERLMPSVSFWLKVKLELDQLDYYSDRDQKYKDYISKSNRAGIVRPPTSAYWKEYAETHNKVQITHLEEQHDEGTDVFYSIAGVKMMAMVGATKQELFANFGKMGEKVAEDLHMVDAPYIEGLKSVFDVNIDPDEEVVHVVKSNPKYPPKRPTEVFPHHQEPIFISVPPCEVDLDDIDADKLEIGEALADLGKSHVCSEGLIQEIFERKDEFSAFDAKQFNDARVKANPWETIGKAIFQNRAAMKMANMDAIFNFTNSPEFKPLAPDCGDPGDYFFFADICAGPGGFTDYLYWRLDGRAKGFGMTLAGDHDWAQSELFVSHIPNFTKVYGPEGNGNIFNPNNIEALYNAISADTDNRMVQLVTADGGMAVDGQENAQEQAHKRLVLCQYLTALRILRKGGSFLCKVFDVYTDFSVEMMYLLAQCFEKFCIIKPYTSRPANSERYVIGLGLREQDPPARSLFSRLNESDIWSKTDKEPLSFFPFDKIPEEFIQYVKNSCEYLVEYQDKACVNLLTYGYNPDLRPLDQEDVKMRCLNEWKIPLTVNRREIIKKCQDFRPAEKKPDSTVENMFPMAQQQEAKVIAPPSYVRSNEGLILSSFGENLISTTQKRENDNPNFIRNIDIKNSSNEKENDDTKPIFTFAR